MHEMKLSDFLPKYRVEIENVVASAKLGKEVKLPMLAELIEGAEYNPERFPGVVLRTDSPKAAALIFGSGKIICTGAKSPKDVEDGLKKVFEKMRSAGIDVEEPKIKIQNIVASADLHTELDLDTISASIGLENVEYEPEMFPGLVYRMEEPKTVILLFGSGKMIITGAKKPEDCEVAVRKIVHELEELGLVGKR
jgi:transcription initiation factor TFIID TATA-box-binding protein